MVARNWGKEKWKVTATCFGVSSRGHEHVVQLDGGDGCTTL